MNNPHLFSDDEWRQLVQHMGLTRRQSEILCLVLRGQSDRQIAMELGISFPTVRAHLQRAFETQGVTDRTMLVVAVFRCFRKCVCPKNDQQNT